LLQVPVARGDQSNAHLARTIFTDTFKLPFLQNA
jgi:hypothetical protein